MSSPTANFFDLRNAHIQSNYGSSPVLNRKSDNTVVYKNKDEKVYEMKKKLFGLLNLKRLIILSICWMVLLCSIGWVLKGDSTFNIADTTQSYLVQNTSLSSYKKTQFRLSAHSIKYFDWGPNTEDQIKVYKEKTMLLLFYNKEDVSHPKLLEQIKQLAHDNQTTPMIYVSVESSEMSPFEFFLDDDPQQHLPFAVITEPQHGFRKFKLDISPNYETLKQFAADYYKGELKAWLRSEKTIKEDSTLVIKQITSKEFPTLVLNDNKHDALVFFYAPWCGHCKRFNVILEEIALKIKNVEHIQIYKIDATKNDIDHSEIAIERVPYVRFFSAKEKNRPIVFKHTEPKLLEYAITFLQQYSSQGLDIEAADKKAALKNTNVTNEF